MEGKPSNQPSPPRAQVKKENEEEIKEFAETAMNELLGWYGYERLELRRWAASRARDASSPEQSADHKNKDECSWCNKSITSESGALQQAGAAFCSELCFSQSRRANFKRAKTCDWCRHVRHTVAYVDFQDGATQLQFCSDKCLNQYKMHIFCRETQAHLELNPHLVSAASSSNLITPELWLKNCKSRSASPASERSGSPNPDTAKQTTQDKTETPKTQKSPLPLITIAPTAKLMKQKRTSEEDAPVHKSPEAKKDTKNKMNLRKRRTSKCSSTVTSQTVRQRTATPKAQDLRLCSPAGGSPPAPGPAPPSPPHAGPAPPYPSPMFGMPPPMYVDNHPHMNDLRHPAMFPPRMGFMPRPGMQLPQERLRLPPPTGFPQPFGQGPPVTVLVPYPVILPLPIPIPIPMPLTAFMQAHRSTKVKQEAKSDDTDVPLDFTMNGHRREEPVEEPSAASAEVEDSIAESMAAEHSDVNERVEEERQEEDTTETVNPEQTLPKFKITRLGNKMAKIVAKARDSESTRPLRKRRRLVDAADDDALIPKTRKIVQV